MDDAAAARLGAAIASLTERVITAQPLVRALVEARKNRMPEIGGKSLAADIKGGLASLKQQLAELRLDAAGALTELHTEIVNGKEGVKRIRAETAAVRDAFAEILGNEGAVAAGKDTQGG